MITFIIAIFITLAFLGILFAIAYYTEKGKIPWINKFINLPIFYALSFSIYCTDWTFYGSIGKSSTTLLGFLPVYLGPTVMVTAFLILFKKTIRISKTHNLNSIADFLSARYGKSGLVGGLVTVLLMLGVLPYISLQLKGIHKSFEIISRQESGLGSEITAFFITILLILFSIIFGTRKLDTSERHSGLLSSVVAAGIIKISAFIGLGIYSVWFIYNGHNDLLSHAVQNEQIKELLIMDKLNPVEWFTVFVLSMFAILLLPHMYQIGIVENRKESHLKKAIWVFPTYLILINLFVIPILFVGILTIGNLMEADSYALGIPILQENIFVSFLVYIGGLAAATGMAFMAIVALSTMTSNNLILPFLLNKRILNPDKTPNLSPWILGIRRGSIVVLFLIAFTYYQTVGKYFSLVSIGLVSFAAVFQLVPSFIGALYWRNGNRKGAIVGLVAGFSVWAFTLPFSQMISSGLFPDTIFTEGLFGIGFLKPKALFGLEGFDMMSHSVFWSFLLNAGSYVMVSLFTRSEPIEKTQALSFVDIFKASSKNPNLSWNGEASFPEVKKILFRFLGEKTANKTIENYELENGLDFHDNTTVDSNFLKYAESVLSGSIGSTSARSVLSMVVRENKSLNMEQMLDILDESKRVREYSEELKNLKQKQDGDYYLTSLLLRPLSYNDMNLNQITGDYILKQNKEFEFRKWKSELGGDICILSQVQLFSKSYAFFLNADAMGKSMQGAGGAIVMGSLFRSIIDRTNNDEDSSFFYPETWLKRSFAEAQKIFETFQGTMVISLSMGLIDEETGIMYYLIAEHPRMILMRDNKAGFIQEDSMLMKLGVSGLEGKIQINTFQLKKGDCLFIGSDGKDDLDLNFSQNAKDKRRLNEDENLFLKVVEDTKGEIDKILDELNQYGHLTDDLSLIQIQFNGDIPQAQEKDIQLIREIRRAEDLYKQGEHSNSLQTLRAINILESQDISIYTRIGKLGIVLKDPDMARKHLEMAIQYQPADKEVLFLLSIVYKKLGDLHKSVQFGERLKLLDPQHINNRVQLIRLYTKTNNWKKAYKNFEELKRLFPDEKSIPSLERWLYQPQDANR